MIRSNPNLVKRRLMQEMARHGVAATLRWTVLAGGTVDQTTGSTVGGTATEQSEAIKGLWHDIEAGGQVKQHQWQNYEVLHALYEIPPETVIEGRANFRVEKDGQLYVQAAVQSSGKVARQIEYFKGVPLYRTLALVKMV